MPVQVEEAVANLTRRWAREEAEDALAAAAARGKLPQLAAMLRARGASKVLLFGSLAEGRFRMDSDIDLAVRGLDERSLAHLAYDLTLAAGRQVDVVPLESASPSLVRRIQEMGEPLG